MSKYVMAMAVFVVLTSSYEAEARVRAVRFGGVHYELKHNLGLDQDRDTAYIGNPVSRIVRPLPRASENHVPYYADFEGNVFIDAAWPTARANDCAPDDPARFQLANVGRDRDSDGESEAAPSVQCVGQELGFVEQTWYQDENDQSTWRPAEDLWGFGDCDDQNPLASSAAIFVLDGDLDYLADDRETKTGCPGERVEVVRVCPGGSCVRIAYLVPGNPGSCPMYWVPLLEVKIDPLTREPILDSAPGCPLR